MPKIIKPLSESQVKNAKPQENQYRLYDGEGMYLIVYPDGRKRWLLKSCLIYLLDLLLLDIWNGMKLILKKIMKYS